MAEELLERVLREIRERKQAAQGAVDEFARLERALAALDRDEPDRPIAAASTPGRGRRSSKPRKRAPRGANRDAIIALVRERPGVTAGEIAEVAGIARSTVSPSLARLMTQGVIERVELPGGGRGFRAVSTDRG